MKFWNKTHIIAKYILLIVVAVLIHIMFFRQTYAENFGKSYIMHLLLYD